MANIRHPRRGSMQIWPRVRSKRIYPRIRSWFKGSADVVPLGFNSLEIGLALGLELKEIIIKLQHNCASMDKWKNVAKKLNFLLLKHEYIFVFINKN